MKRILIVISTFSVFVLHGGERVPSKKSSSKPNLSISIDHDSSLRQITPLESTEQKIMRQTHGKAVCIIALACLLEYVRNMSIH